MSSRVNGTRKGKLGLRKKQYGVVRSAGLLTRTLLLSACACARGLAVPHSFVLARAPRPRSSFFFPAQLVDFSRLDMVCLCVCARAAHALSVALRAADGRLGRAH
jgi:hypothetical protein